MRYTLERRCWRACGEDVSFTNVKIEIPDRKVDQWMWMTSCTGIACGGFWRFWKRQLVESCRPKKKADFRSLTEALWRVPHVLVGGGADGKASIERSCLSPYVEKPFNSKVIKSFVPELRSRKCFSCFGIPMFYVYMLWTFYVHFTYSYLAMLQLAFHNKEEEIEWYEVWTNHSLVNTMSAKYISS